MSLTDDTGRQRRNWTERAATHGDSPQGVLPAGLPPTLNAALHGWHRQVVEAHFLPRLSAGARVVDLAAGYGRLSQVMRAARPDLRLTGLDFAQSYSQRYLTGGNGPAVCADLRRLPAATGTWDAALVVTGLMYVAPDELATTIAGIHDCLRTGGAALFLDPGAELGQAMQRAGLIPQRRSTGGSGFSAAGYAHQFAATGWRICVQGANPLFTLALPMLLAVESRWPRLAERLAWQTVALDLALPKKTGYAFPVALHRWLIVEKTPDGDQ